MECPSCGSDNIGTRSDPRDTPVIWFCFSCRGQWEMCWPAEAMATWPAREWRRFLKV